ncbi:MAG: NAD(P)H-hydrate epimerase [Halobacteriales archaeon]|nr:NAD(P)H-hydrate epimerase [Halobacteriales archaeon]
MVAPPSWSALVERGCRDCRSSLDVPSGVDATSGARPGAAIRPDVTVTLALPKTGLRAIDGKLLVADIGIPHRVYGLAGLAVGSPFSGEGWRVILERPPT